MVIEKVGNNNNIYCKNHSFTVKFDGLNIFILKLT